MCLISAWSNNNVLFKLLLAVMLLCFDEVWSQSTVLLPFGYDAGDELFVQGYRHFTDPVSLLCQFYGVEEDTLFVNINGVVSFRGPFTDYRDSRPFPLAGSDVLIAPFWADSTNIEIIGGQIFFRLDNRTLLNEVGSTVNDALIYECDFTPTVLFIATWNRTYFDNSPENVNTFQVVLATDGSRTFVIFLYHDIQWTSDTTIGFNAGDRVNYYIVPESLTADGVLNLNSTSNVGIPGIYIYRVDQDPSIPVSAPDPVTDLECPDSGDGAVLLISWTSPGSNDSYTYTIEIQEYYQDNIRLTLLLRPLNPPFNQEVHVAIADEVTINVTSGVEMFVPYSVVVTPACSNLSRIIDCFTEEGVPTVSPSFVVTSNQSAIVVTWELLTLIEARGFIEYLVHLHKESSAERQSIQFPMSEDSATFTGLEMCARYEVSMGTRTLSSGATGPESERKTLELSCSSTVSTIGVLVGVILVVIVFVLTATFVIFTLVTYIRRSFSRAVELIAVASASPKSCTDHETAIAQSFAVMNHESTSTSQGEPCVVSCPGLLTKGQGSAHVDVESIITPQEEPLVVSELGQNDDTTRGQGSVHVKSIITPQGEGPELGQNNDTTRGQGSARVESMTSQGEQLAMCTIHTITPGGVPTMPKLICFPSTSNGNINLAEEIGGDYFNFGTLLLDDNDGNKVSAIERELMRNAENINSRIFTLWLKGKGKQPVTWSTLANVLQDIGHNKLAESIRKSYVNN